MAQDVSANYKSSNPDCNCGLGDLMLTMHIDEAGELLKKNPEKLIGFCKNHKETGGNYLAFVGTLQELINYMKQK